MVRIEGSGGCPECVDWPAELAAASAVCRMEGPALRLVHALKYEGWFALGPELGTLCAGAARRMAGDERHLLVPVPLAPARRRERGFNQAELLASGIAERTGWPVGKVLTRRPGGRRQARLSRRERRENVRGRFRAEAPAVGGEPPAVIVDDVLTTGATAAACARALSDAGYRVSGAVAFGRRPQVG